MERGEARLIRSLPMSMRLLPPLTCLCVALDAACAGPLLAQAPQAPQAPHDGSWAIEIVTERGACERLYRYYVVVDGQVVRLRSMSGETSQDASGFVRADGRINATVGQPDDPVKVTGRLAATSGTGVWSAPARQCAGRWSAHKRA
jgi:hypothetical protein